jgi:hypothetical protein
MVAGLPGDSSTSGAGIARLKTNGGVAWKLVFAQLVSRYLIHAVSFGSFALGWFYLPS